MNVLMLVLKFVVSRIVNAPLLLVAQVTIFQTFVQRLVLLAKLFMSLVVRVVEPLMERFMVAVRICGRLVLAIMSAGRYRYRKHDSA
jgi:hypothetical protein